MGQYVSAVLLVPDSAVEGEIVTTYISVTALYARRFVYATVTVDGVPLGATYNQLIPVGTTHAFWWYPEIVMPDHNITVSISVYVERPGNVWFRDVTLSKTVELKVIPDPTVTGFQILDYNKA